VKSNRMPRIVPCLRCGAPFQRTKGPRTPFCLNCRKVNNNAQRKVQRGAIEADRAFIAEIAGNLRGHITPEMQLKVEEYLAAIGATAEPAVVPEKQSGEQRRMKIIMDEWFAENPQYLQRILN